MFRNRIYYRIKPFLPRRLRLFARRILARRTLRNSRNQWPIDPGSGAPPENWRGWPYGCDFAFVLTHDVEGPDGLRKCRKLMALEIEQGFRSSFNFVPEGRYSVPPELRRELTRNGFETGVHDLNHDGHLYDSASGFKRRAKRINRYLKIWNAVGFRSAFMFHNLSWLNTLDISYDLSTFDTDPFEPQPDGQQTIFPFRVGENGSTYVEMPYTLPQDSTLFLVLDQPDIRIWREKLDWVAAHGGMALVNVHPDYIHFDNGRPPSGTYPAAHYRELLEYVRSRYAGCYWSALPRDVAHYVSGVSRRWNASVNGDGTRHVCSRDRDRLEKDSFFIFNDGKN